MNAARKTADSSPRARVGWEDLDAQTTRWSDGDRLVSTDELAALLGVAVGTVHWMQHEGKLPASVRVGRRRMWWESHLRTWLDDMFRAQVDDEHETAA